ncbi:sugar ABC transporter permease [soil metagenome]|jgi:alpha-glucoside transport system permease protein
MAQTPTPVPTGLGGPGDPPAPARAPLPLGRKFDISALFFLGLPGALLIVFVVFPAIYNFALSFNRGRRGEFTEWVGLQNYISLFNDRSFINFSTFPPSGALWNNVLWIVGYVSLVIFLGLIVAVLASRVRYEAVIKAIVFLPMAIAATALAVIWRNVYAPSSNIGLLNAIISPIAEPVSWLGDPAIVNYALIAAGVWGSVGFATVILSAALKGIPGEIIEAARVDGASERAIFFRIIIPMVSLPMSVLAVTLVVNVIKLFDLVFVMTGGGPGTASRVIALTYYQETFPGGQFGKGAAVAVIMLGLMIPIMLYNVRRFRSERVTA